ncbi:MAG: cytidine deaminase [Armatimonadetes bacterium RBG_16_67_12]|nr:MAG: cytidine deaminase [Armatimonadetes bacterium RBG_16_67_12]
MTRASRPSARATDDLIRAARSARRRAYAPYSGFHVGAAVLTGSGAVASGCNVENASFGLSICAERAAVHLAIAEGHRRLLAVAVSSGPAEATPCGACRQVLAEFGVRTVIIDRPRGDPLVFDLADLLAHPFAGTRLRRRS